MTTSRSKQCNGECGEVKSLSEFYVYKKSGKLWGKCKVCAIARQKYRNRVLARDQYLKYQREKSRVRSSAVKQTAESNAARKAVSRAIKAGRLERPPHCQACGKIGPVDAHHHDYSKPLAVVFVCKPCHQQHHAMMDLIERVMNQ